MKAYYDKTLGRVVWDYEAEYKPNTRKRESAHVYAAPDGCYLDWQLPRNCEEHRKAGGKFTPDGKCYMTGIRQIEKTMDLCNDNGSGCRIDYDRPFYRRR